MISEHQTSLFAREQFRMTRLQVFNWGTFSGLHDVPISERGFLFVGQSGAGKSTLLDAFSALLVPPRLVKFNAAAHEADHSVRDRNLVSYIRGAWAEQKDEESGEIATRYLRLGATWSALALTYQNLSGQFVVLAQVFWLRGNANGTTDVKRHYLVLERAFNLRELENFGKPDLDIRRLKQSFSEEFARDEFSPYCEHFRHLLGIESEMALRLLHKTQSAKNLGDLNIFLRDFMLDEPKTFEVADLFVSEFVELNAAHQTVVTAGEQVQTLVPAREQHQNMNSLNLQCNALKELLSGVDGYREIQRIKLLRQNIASLEMKASGLQGEVSRRQTLLDNHATTLRELERQRREAGGGQIEQWEAEKSGLEDQRAERLRKHSQTEGACKKLGWSLPDSPQAFAELLGNARQEVENLERRSSENREEQFRLADQKKDAETASSQTVKEVQALQRQPSNIPADMLDMRRDIAAGIGILESALPSALPFVGELLEVKPDAAEWRGAIERVLRGFALSLLVDDHQYLALAKHINNTHLGQHLVYYRTGRPEPWQDKLIGANSLILKLNVKEGPYADWLHAELRQRFDYACVDSVQVLKSADRAITREGQVKHSKIRHEKDDRRSVDDRLSWVLGFDNREKLKLFQAQARELAATITRLGEELKNLDDQDKSRMGRAMQCQILVNLQWQEIDVIPLLDRISTIERQIREAREGNITLLQISERMDKKKNLVYQAEMNLLDSKGKHDSVLKQINDSTQKITSILQESSSVPLTPHQINGLDERFTKQADAISLESLDKTATAVERGINTEIDEIKKKIGTCEKEIEARFADFKRKWPMEAGDMDTSLSSAPDFFAKLLRLETDGLPAYRQRFFDLMKNQSYQTLSRLSARLNGERKDIKGRMEPVNDSLSRVPFNQSANQRTYLHIDVSDRQLPEVKEFKQEIQEALSYAWSEDHEVAEERFQAVRRLVDRLDSKNPEQKRWRDMVLDVRQHVEFIGRETDESGVDVEIYRSGAGKSGGQRQKLATTCLAAALRYQLGGNDHGVPMYAPIVLDEAFDKADDEFTALAMNIFIKFGFQMIVATPLKSIMTLEPFIGGACFVGIRDRKVSSVFLIEYDYARQGLNLKDSVEAS